MGISAIVDEHQTVTRVLIVTALSPGQPAVDTVTDGAAGTPARLQPHTGEREIESRSEQLVKFQRSMAIYVRML